MNLARLRSLSLSAIFPLTGTLSTAPIFAQAIALANNATGTLVRSQGDRFDKTAFVLDWQRQEIRCPNQVSVPFSEGKVVQFRKQQCSVCALRSRCTKSSKGRSVSMHPDEALMQELRERQSTPAGRTQLRQ